MCAIVVTLLTSQSPMSSLKLAYAGLQPYVLIQLPLWPQKRYDMSVMSPVRQLLIWPYVTSATLALLTHAFIAASSSTRQVGGHKRAVVHEALIEPGLSGS